jgi:hypothetical protein
MANDSPIYEVFTVVNRNAGKIFEGGRHQVKVVANTANAWIGIHAGYDGILEGSLAAEWQNSCEKKYCQES